MAQRPPVMTDSLQNRGTAFTSDERKRLGLIGRLPSAVETLDEQAARCYRQISRYETDLEKYTYLDQLHDRNEVLYYKVIVDHLSEMLPIVYDPTIGDAIKQWSNDYRESRAVYLSIDRPDDVRESFEGLGLGPDDVDLIVVSDAQEILGIGDWGVNGTDISVGKLAVYTAAAGIDPSRVVAVNLDVGTDNEVLLNNPEYLGNRHARITGERYDDFIALYLKTASELYPNALLQFEDFGPSNARRILEENRDSYRIFNDDMQGTGAIVMSAVFSGLKVTKQSFADQRLLVFGAGTAGTGMADQISAAMIRDGLTADEAKARGWLVDVNGLVIDDMPDLPNYQAAYARPAAEVADWARTDFHIGQANNALLYPGLGLGTIVSGATHVTDGMLLAAAEAVADQVDPTGLGASLLPDVDNLRASSATVALAVAKQAMREGVATKSYDNLVQAVEDAMWQPVYAGTPE